MSEEVLDEYFERAKEVFRRYLQQSKLPDVILDPPPDAPLNPRRWEVLGALRAVLSNYIDEDSGGFSLKLSPCRYVTIEVYLSRGSVIRVEWVQR